MTDLNLKEVRGLHQNYLLTPDTIIKFEFIEDIHEYDISLNDGNLTITIDENSSIVLQEFEDFVFKNTMEVTDPNEHIIMEIYEFLVTDALDDLETAAGGEPVSGSNYQGGEYGSGSLGDTLPGVEHNNNILTAEELIQNEDQESTDVIPTYQEITGTRANDNDGNPPEYCEEIVRIDIFTVNDLDKGYEVTAYKLNGDEGTISIDENVNHEGFGVQGRSSGAGQELGSNEHGSEMISVKFDEDIESFELSMGWQNSREDAEISFFDREGKLLAVHEFKGITDRIDDRGSVNLTDFEPFAEIQFTAPQDNSNDDYLINSITFSRTILKEEHCDTYISLRNFDIDFEIPDIDHSQNNEIIS